MRAFMIIGGLLVGGCREGTPETIPPVEELATVPPPHADAGSPVDSSTDHPDTKMRETLCGLFQHHHSTVPAFENGHMIGFKMFSLRENEVAQRVGLQNGDIILEINSEDMGKMEGMQRVVEQLDSCSALRLKIKRNGKVIDLH
jgi:C-terminal processing protease CtpA/Prc